MKMNCCICLNEIVNEAIKELSCNHVIHYRCYLKCTFYYRTKFINCPLCRQTNFNTDKPIISDRGNLKMYLSSSVGEINCVCNTKSGFKCKNKSLMFNYGMCQVHNKDILKQKHFNIFLIYLDYIFTNNSMKSWKTKLYLLDMSKKLIIKHNLRTNFGRTIS